MQRNRFCRHSPGLLVSVRSTSEALAALAGGADVIDIKEPDRGPLGPADPPTIAEIVRVVAGRVPVSAALGELLDGGKHGAAHSIESLPAGICLGKIGLSGCGDVSNWRLLWGQAAAAISRAATHETRPVAVVYADWQAARAPQPADVLLAATDYGCPALLVDTWNKSSGNLIDHWRVNNAGELSGFVDEVRTHRMAIVLAGSLNGPSIASAALLAPDLVAVRGAACEGGRSGAVAWAQVALLKQMIGSSQRLPRSPLRATP